MKRADLQAMAEAKLEDAQLLFRNGRFSNACYLAGYAIEFGLKACIARQVQAETIPSKSFIGDTWVHDVRKLVSVAGLGKTLKERIDADPDFSANWAIVSEWTVDARYEPKDPMTAQLLLTAIAEPNTGVLPWIRIYW